MLRVGKGKRDVNDIGKHGCDHFAKKNLPFLDCGEARFFNSVNL